MELLRYQKAAGKVDYEIHLLDRLDTKDWQPKWRKQLDDSAGVLVLFTETYRKKLASGSAVAWEARQILEWRERNPNTKFFALDPGKVGQDESKLRLTLLDNEEPEIGWRKWKQVVDAAGEGGEGPGAARTPGPAVEEREKDKPTAKKDEGEDVSLSEWLKPLNLKEDDAGAVLAHLDELGATTPKDLALLDEEDVTELEALVVPKISNRRFKELIRHARSESGKKQPKESPSGGGGGGGGGGPSAEEKKTSPRAAAKKKKNKATAKQKLAAKRKTPEGKSLGQSLIGECHKSVLDLKRVKSLVKQGAALDETDAEGTTALMIAASKGDVKAVSELLAGGASTQTRDKLGNTAHTYASVNWKTEVTDLLRSHRDAMALLDAERETPRGKELGKELLAVCAKASSTSTFSTSSTSFNSSKANSLLSQGASANEADENGCIPLLWVALNGYASIVSALVRAGAKLEHRLDPEGLTALLAAAAAGHEDVVSVLLDAGADTAAKTKGGETARELALAGGHSDVVELLDQRAAAVAAAAAQKAAAEVGRRSPGGEAKGRELLHLTSTEFFSEFTNRSRLAREVLELANQGASFSVTDERGRTALMWATTHESDPEAMMARDNRTEALYVLLQAGADVEARDKDGMTALMHAVESGATTSVSMLLEAGAQLSPVDNRGRTARDMAGYNCLPILNKHAESTTES